MHPYPVVTHPERNVLQAASVIKVVAASVQIRALQFVAPVVVSIVHDPSVPINPVHPKV